MRRNPVNRHNLQRSAIAAFALFIAAGLTLVINQAGAAHDNDEVAVRDTLLKSAISFEKNDVDLAAKIWANDETLVVFESGHANYGWTDYPITIFFRK